MSRKNRPETPASLLVATGDNDGAGEHPAIATAATIPTALIKDAAITDLVVQSDGTGAPADALQVILAATGFASVEALTHMAKIGRDIVVLIDGYRAQGAPTIFYPGLAEDPTEVVADLFMTILSLRERIKTAGAAFAVTISPSSTDQDREKLLEAFDAIGVDVRAMVPQDNFATWSVEPAVIGRDNGPSFAEELAELLDGKDHSGFAERFPLMLAAAATFKASNEPGIVPTAIRITSEREAFRRAGIVHSRARRDYPTGAFSAEQIESLSRRSRPDS